MGEARINGSAGQTGGPRIAHPVGAGSAGEPQRHSAGFPPPPPLSGGKDCVADLVEKSFEIDEVPTHPGAVGYNQLGGKKNQWGLLPMP